MADRQLRFGAGADEALLGEWLESALTDPFSGDRRMRNIALCRGQWRGAGLLVVAFGSPGGDHCIWNLERLIEYGRRDDAVGSKVPDSLRSSHHTQTSVAST